MLEDLVVWVKSSTALDLLTKGKMKSFRLMKRMQFLLWDICKKWQLYLPVRSWIHLDESRLGIQVEISDVLNDLYYLKKYF